MKTKKIILLLALISPFLYLEINSQNLPEVISLRELEMSEGTNEIIFLNYYNRWCENIELYSKGAGGWVMKGDRGNRTGEYIFAWTFDFKSTRDYYFPPTDTSNYPQWQAILQKINFHAPDKPLVDSIRSFTDFIVIGFDNMVAPQLGEVIAVRYFDIPLARQAEFESFIANVYHPAFQENIEGYYNYVLKGDRGNKAGSYLLLTVFDSADRRDIYFPVPLDPPSDKFQTQWLKVEKIAEKFNTYIPESLAYDYTDYIRVY